MIIKSNCQTNSSSWCHALGLQGLQISTRPKPLSHALGHPWHENLHGFDLVLGG